ncbi:MULTISPECIES: VRR-NUC domain-containing protein [unclassified Vibrio]|uniref:phosphodiesterase I n=1 Tax=Vibrio sp. HB236076 TaxID=3232307 RepID=A0AB39HJ15_9VIBR|nr:VRR-NUC domain-containing protein [Vibrio sp. HB161653]MDP5252855.1 VRR-NUC domain-containing protein [Vibrio sp. HB161653]
MTETAPPLAVYYYRDNFQTLIEHALSFSHLLTECEKQWLADYQTLAMQTQCLLVRILSRKGPYYRQDKFQYPELDDIAARFDELRAHGFIDFPETLPFADIADKLTKGELQPLLNGNKHTTKKALLSLIEPQHNIDQTQLPCPCFCLQQAEILPVLLGLFFANHRQDLSQFVLNDLGVQRFEDYQYTGQHAYFHHRSELDALLTINQIKQDWFCNPNAEVSTLLTWLQAVPVADCHKGLQRKSQALISQLARQLERQQDAKAAMPWYQRTNMPPSRERQARFYLQQGEFDQAKRLLDEMLATPFGKRETITAYTLLKQWQKRAQASALEGQPRQVATENREDLALKLQGQRVEHAVCQHYQQDGWQCFYSENHFLNGLFGLAFWHVIFSPVPYAFIHPFQSRPLDMYHDDFCQSRQQAIQQVFEHIKTQGLTECHATYQQKFAIQNDWVHWGAFDPQWIDLAEQHIERSTLIGLFEYLLQDLRDHKIGMPDLIAFKDGQFRWVEVKGPGDKLQHHQKEWQKTMTQLGIDYCTAYVEVID